MYAGFVAQASPPHATVAAPPAPSFVAQLPIHVTAAATNSVAPPAINFVAEPPAPHVTAATSFVAPPATSFVVQLPPPAPHATATASSVTPPATGCTHLCCLPRKSEQEEVVVSSKPSTEVVQMGAAIVDANKTINMQTERLDKLQEQVKDLTKEKKDLTNEKKELSNEKKKLMKQLTHSGELCLMVERLKNQRQEVIDAAHLQQQAATQEVASLTENNASLLRELGTAQLEQLRSNSQIEALEKVCGGRSAPSEFQQELVALRQQLSDVSALEISELQRTVRAQEKLLQSALAEAQQEKRRSSLYRRLIGLVDSQLLPDAIVKSLHPEEEQRQPEDASESGDPEGKVRQDAAHLLLRQQDDEALARSKSREIIADVSRLCDENEDLAARARAAEDKHQSLLRTVEVQEKTILEHQQSLVAASSPKRAGKVGSDASVVAAHPFPRATAGAAAADAEVRAPGLMSLFGGLLTSNLACNRCGHIQAAEIGLQALSHALSESQATVLDRVLSELNEHLCEPGSECGLQPISHLLRSYGTLDSQPGSGTGVYVYRPSAQVTAIRVFLLLDQQTAAHYLSQAPLKDEAFAYKLALLYLLLSPQLVCTAEFMDLLLDQVRFLWLPLQLLESEVGEMEQRLLPRAPLGHPAPHLTGSHQKLGYASGGSCICGDQCGDHVYCLESGDVHVAPPTSPPRVPDEVGWTSRAHLIMTRLVPRLEQAIKVKAVFASFLSGGPGRSGSSLHETAALARMHPAVQEELQRARPSYHFLEAAAASVNLAAAAEEEEGLLPRERRTPQFHFKELCRFQVENL